MELMLTGHTILCIGYGRWTDRIMDWEEMRRFAEQNRVIFVDTQEKYESLRSSGMTRRSCVQTFSPRSPQRIDDNLVVIQSPAMLPLCVSLLSRVFHQAIGRSSIILSKKILELYIKHQLSILGIRPDILWLHQPQDTLLAGKFGESMVCYRTFDELSLFPSNVSFRKLLDDIERRNIGKVDLIFTSSQSQYEKRKAMNPRSYVVPNAVDFDLFDDANKNEHSRPADLPAPRQPVIGFMGSVDFRFDFNLVRDIASHRPEWSVVLIGLARQYALPSLKQLTTLPNVHWLGPKMREELPAYLTYFDVGIIPYLVNDVTNTMYPWKFHEYLAAGLPVVSTNLAELQCFRDIVHLAKSSEEYIAAIERELQCNSSEMVQHRKQIARENTWETRIENMSQLIEKHWRTKNQFVRHL